MRIAPAELLAYRARLGAGDRGARGHPGQVRADARAVLAAASRRRAHARPAPTGSSSAAAAPASRRRSTSSPTRRPGAVELPVLVGSGLDAGERRASCSRVADGAIVGTSLLRDGRADADRVASSGACRRRARTQAHEHRLRRRLRRRSLRRSRRRPGRRHRAERRGAPAAPVRPGRHRLGARARSATTRRRAIVRAAVERAGLDDRLVRRPGATSIQHIRHAAGGERLFTRFEEGVLRGFELGPAERAADRRRRTSSRARPSDRASTSSRRCSPARRAACGSWTSRTRTTSETSLSFVERHAARFDVGLFGLSRADGGPDRRARAARAPPRSAARGHARRGRQPRARRRGAARAAPRCPSSASSTRPGPATRSPRASSGRTRATAMSRRRSPGGAPSRAETLGQLGSFGASS